MEYASWRVMQGIVGIFALIAYGIMWFYFPETSQPGTRGIDKLHYKAESGAKTRWSDYVVNPFAPLGLLRAPNMLVVVSARASVCLVDGTDMRRIDSSLCHNCTVVVW